MQRRAGRPVGDSRTAHGTRPRVWWRPWDVTYVDTLQSDWTGPMFAFTIIILKEVPPATEEWWKNPATLIALVSALVALASALFTASSARTAKNTYRLAAEQDARREPQLTPYLSDAHILSSGSRTEAAISITVTNRSDIDNSIARAELAVEYHRDNDRATTIKIPSNNDTSGLPLTSDNLLYVPNDISSHQTIAGWLVFSMPEWLLRDCVIDNYSLSIYDSNEEVATLPDLLLRQSFDSPEEHRNHERQKEQEGQEEKSANN